MRRDVMFGLCVRAYACACVRVCACVRGESTPELGVPCITARLLAGSRCLPTNKSVLCPISPPFSAEKHRGDMVAVMLQEICTYDADDKVTMLQGKTKGPEIAECVLQACPVASVRTQRGALGALGAASGPPFLEINLQACGRARLGGPCSGPHVPVPVGAALHACMHADGPVRPRWAQRQRAGVVCRGKSGRIPAAPPVMHGRRMARSSCRGRRRRTFSRCRRCVSWTPWPRCDGIESCVGARDLGGRVAMSDGREGREGPRPAALCLLRVHGHRHPTPAPPNNAQSSPVELGGACTISCPASGLTATLKFRDEHAVKGGVQRRGSDARVAVFSGAWDGGVNVEVPELGVAGTVFAARPQNPPLLTTVGLAAPGPQRAMRLWSAMLQSMYYVDAHQVRFKGPGG